MHITERRICWPKPDATCLEGGCIYCNDKPFRSIAEIVNYVARKRSPVKNRGNNETKTAWDAFSYGLRYDFSNAEVVYSG